MAGQASHSVFFEDNFRNVSFANASFTPYPSTQIFHQKRLGRPMLNGHARNKLFLNAAPLPSEEKEEMAAIKQTINEPTSNKPLYQIMASIDSMEQSIDKKIDALQEMGMDGYAEKKMKESMASGDDNVVETPDNSDALAGSVISTNEPKVTPRKRKKNALLPIVAHDMARKKSKKKII